MTDLVLPFFIPVAYWGGIEFTFEIKISKTSWLPEWFYIGNVQQTNTEAAKEQYRCITDWCTRISSLRGFKICFTSQTAGWIVKSRTVYRKIFAPILLKPFSPSLSAYEFTTRQNKHIQKWVNYKDYISVSGEIQDRAKPFISVKEWK